MEGEGSDRLLYRGERVAGWRRRGHSDNDVAVPYEEEARAAWGLGGPDGPGDAGPRRKEKGGREKRACGPFPVFFSSFAFFFFQRNFQKRV